MDLESNQTEEDEIANLQRNKNVFIVGVGASAGGYEAIETFFKNMPSNTGMAFVIIQHLSPDFKSLMVELLSKHTSMNVYRVEDGMQVKPNCVYLIPPRKTMTIFQEQLFLREIKKDIGLNLPINLFFRSLANNSKENAIGIILSGTGSDGTLGIRDIKGAGGMVMVQDANSAKFDGMPKSALATGLVDFVARCEDMPDILIKFVNHLSITNDNLGNNIKAFPGDRLSKLMSIIHNSRDLDFTYYKNTTILRRIEKRMGICQIKTFDEYLELLESSPGEVSTLVDELLINVTNFFRDPEAFDYLKKVIIPKIFANRRVNQPIRIWVTACSTGEEPYSIAITFKEYMEESGETAEIKIFATDIDNNSLSFAATGLYTENIIVDVSTERLAKYFVRKENNYQIHESIRKMVIFAYQNIIKDAPFNKIDLVTCRNLLIYFDTTAQKRALSYIHFALNPMSFLFLGKSETVGAMVSHFKSLDNRLKIFQKIGNHTLSLDMREDLFKSMNVPNQPISYEAKSAYSKKKSLEEAIYHELMFSHEPSALMVDSNNNIEFIFGKADKYIRMNRGRINLSINKNLINELTVAVNTALHKAKKIDKEVIYKDIIIKEEDKVTTLNLTVKPVSVENSTPGSFFIIFDEIENKTILKDEGEVYNPSTQSAIRIKELETELQITKENLQATVEELETSNEELQATNEELLASNEELQSTNEELQSVNEELITVNAEYLQKLEDLIQITNDFDNLLSSTQIATLFLDKELKIRKFTPNIQKFFNIAKIDIGRPISNFSFNLNIPDILNYFKLVITEGKSFEFEIKITDSEYYILRMLQFLAADKVVEGLVITIIDISSRKIAEVNMKRSEERFRSAFEYSGIGMGMLSLKGDFLKVNRRICELFGFSEDEFLEMNFHDLAHPDYLHENRNTFSQLMMDKINSLEIKQTFIHKNGNIIIGILSISIVKDDNLNSRYFIIQIRDITEKEKAVNDLKKLQFFVDNDKKNSSLMQELLSLYIYNIDEDKITYSNSVFLELIGIKITDLYNVSFLKLIHEEDRSKFLESINHIKLSKENQSIGIDLRILHKDNYYINFHSSSNTYLRNEKGELSSVITTLLKVEG
jgi:two-component system, chemotaxis family, CheB/CheR fusion protein